LVYLAFWIYDLNACNTGGRGDGRYVQLIRGLPLWRHYVNYFPINLIKTADIPSTKNYIFGSHPHGILCFGVFGALATEGAGFSKLFPGIRPKLLTLEGNFWMPAFRELVMGNGLCSSSKSSIKHLLSSANGSAPTLVVGGIPEISNPFQNKIVLVLKKRKGFIKLALQHGSDLVPIFSFGETDIYSQFNGINSWLQEKLCKHVGFAPVFFSGCGFVQNKFGVLPRRKAINVVVGKPISVDQNSHPTVAEIERLHTKYIDAVIQLYQDHKNEFGYQETELVIT